MSWIFWLGLAVVVGAVAALTGLKPKGTKPVSSSRLMGMARFVLVVLALIFLYLAYRGHARGESPGVLRFEGSLADPTRKR